MREREKKGREGIEMERDTHERGRKKERVMMEYETRMRGWKRRRGRELRWIVRKSEGVGSVEGRDEEMEGGWWEGKREERGSLEDNEGKMIA